MAIIAVRLPHYIVDYIRNRNEQKPIMVGEAVRIDCGDRLAMILQNSLVPNHGNKINVQCFSEKQWRSMSKGHCIGFNDKMFDFDKYRDSSEPLSIEEIYHLCGREDLIRYENDNKTPMPDESYPYEYLTFQLPNVIYLNGKELRVRSDFFLPDANEFIAELRTQFRCALARFIAVDREVANNLELKRSKIESIERFMVRYDIRNGNRERDNLKKMMQRSYMSSAYAFDNDENHGKWSNEHIDICAKKESKKLRPVFCITTGVLYPSVQAFRRKFNLSHSHVYLALNKKRKIKGLLIRYATNEDLTKNK